MGKPIWKTVVGHPDYEVSDYGQVRRATPCCGTRAGKILKQTPAKCGGYPCLALGRKGGRKYVHALVCEAFHGPRPTPTHQVAHGDGNPANNCASNLRWASPKENCDDRKFHGTHLVGERANSSKLTASQVREIRASNEGQRTLADRYGVNRSAIYRIINRVAWRHVQ